MNMKRRAFLTSSLGLASLPYLRLFTAGRRGADGGGRADIREIITRGDIERAHSPADNETWIPLYQGNGRFGSCVGPWGLHAAPGEQTHYNVPGAMRFTHMQHFMRGRYNADYLLPIGSIYWEMAPRGVEAYQQHQSFFDGVVTTRYKASNHEVTIVSWMDPVRRDVAGFEIHASGNCPAIIFSLLRKISLIYDQEVTPAIDTRLHGDRWEARIRCGNADSRVMVQSTAAMQSTGNELKLTLRPGRNTILVAINSDIDVSAEESLAGTRSWWSATWDNGGWLDLPDDDAQKVWVRSMAYTLSSHNDDGMGCPPPTGLAGNAWPFPFPFDSGCRHPLLLWTGQINAAKKWIEFWHCRLDGLKEYTRRLYHTDGIFMPHVFPYGAAYHYHEPGVPNKYYYPVYNTGLMARMADQTAVMVDDPAWAKAYAAPLIGEGAKFYLEHLKKADDGFWHLHLVPSISLDESGDVDKPDYFSGLASAQYALQKAVDYGLDHDGRMKRVLLDGLALAPLVGANGVYRNHAGAGREDLGKQKHPDQLFPLVHLPLSAEADPPTRMAHALRYEIADGARESRFIGHTLGEFILSSARMHDAEAWRRDWSMIRPNRYADPDLIQFYESTGNNLSFYITTHGLFAQALLETVVSAWWGRLDLASCVPWKGAVRFANIRTPVGVTVSGEVKDGVGKATLRAWKDTTLTVKGKSISLRKGQTRVVTI